MSNPSNCKPVEILLVEDSPGDVRLTLESLKESRVRNRVSVVPDGVAALAFLRGQNGYSSSPRPDLILLDLNLPKKDGRQVLSEIKEDPALLSASALRNAQGEIVGVMGISRDITERKQAEIALRRVHEQLELRVQERTAEWLKANAPCRPKPPNAAISRLTWPRRRSPQFSPPQEPIPG